MRLLLIRHGLPLRVTSSDGPADPDLDPRGWAQAEVLAEYLRQEPITAIYASSMRRAQQTAEPLATLLGLAPVIEPAVAESDVRASHYVPAEELKAAGDPGWHMGSSASTWPDYYEPFEQFHERVITGIDGIIARHPGDDEVVAVFCHGGVIGRYTATKLGLPWEQVYFFYPLYTSITRLVGWPTGTMIETLNETPHLRGTGLPTGAIL
ncbi:histidine phosphatase family protein [Blastococcus sp. SYSU D00695]